MRVLFLTQIIPYPPDAGPRIKTWHVLKFLHAQGHKVILASFVRPEERKHVNTLERICEQVYTIPMRRSRLRDIGYLLRSQVTGRPFLVERDDLAGMRTLVHRLIGTGEIDILHADQLTMTQFALPYQKKSRGKSERGPSIRRSIGGHKGHPKLIFDAHNAVWTIVERMYENTNWLLRPVLSLEARRVKRFESWITQMFDATLAVTDQDRTTLLEAVREYPLKGDLQSPRISVIPIAVDTIQLAPIKRQPGSCNIMTLGTLHYPPNADGIRWFLQEIFPQIRAENPNATLTIVGKNPPQDFLRLAEQHPDSITVTGYVPDLVPYMQRAALMVVPVRAGGGMRVRILEAFARAMPLVTTTIGLEGIEARPNEDILVEDTPHGFASAVGKLMKDRSLQLKLAQNGRLLAEKHYDWNIVLRKMKNVYIQLQR